jgi:FtsP/CotA-like multicopper oxidase with cupredoxin domain
LFHFASAATTSSGDVDASGISMMTRSIFVLTILSSCVSLCAVSAQQRASATPAPIAVPPADTVNPPVLVNISKKPHTVEVNLTAAPARLSLVSGVTTEGYAFNGQVPGPTLVAHEGDSVIIHFKNDLPEKTTIHWHGLHVPVTSDGSPFYPIAPGGHYDYVFRIQYGTAGTYWYHPHPDQISGEQLAKGLYGAFIVRAADDPLPSSIPDKILILWDNRFLPDGSLELPGMHTPQGLIDQVNGREGNVLFVSGRVMPTIRIRSGEVQRWRIINASASRVYRLAIPGQELLQVGSDGGLLERPVPVKEILLANSERVEILVRGTEAPGTQTALQDLPYDRYVPQTRPKDWNVAHDLVTLQYSSEPPETPIKLPERLREIPPLDTTKATTTRVISFSQGLINGRTMDMNRVDVSVKIGATEIWQVENLVGMDHPFHLHGFRFQVIDRNGVPEPFRSWKDTVNVPKHQTVRFIVQYADFPGKWMFHCHILDHEDEGMMGVLQVQ